MNKKEVESSEVHFPVALRQLQNDLAQLEIMTRDNPELRATIQQTIAGMLQGWTNQNNPNRYDDETIPTIPENNRGTMPGFPTGNRARSQSGTNTDQRVRVPNIAGLGDANVNASWQNENLLRKIRLVDSTTGAVTQLGKIRPKSLLLQSEGSNFSSKSYNTFNQIQKSSDGLYHLVACISSSERDRDGDRFSKEVEYDWMNTINSGKINLGMDHGHSWKDTLGVWKFAKVIEANNEAYLYADAVLESPDINKDVELLIHKWNNGEQVSISIAANPSGDPWFKFIKEKDGTETRLITKATLLKADIVGEPANQAARAVTISNTCACGDGSCLSCMGARA